MTPREQEVLDLVRDDPLISQAEIAKRLGISRSAAAGHIMNLTAKGIIRGRGYVVTDASFVAVVGGSNMDICASPAGSLRLGDSNPGTVTTSPGGVARNVAENLARLSVDCRLISAVGTDHHGNLLLAHGRRAGIDMNAVLQLDDSTTSTYVSMLDDASDMHVAVNDMSIVERLQPDRLRTHEQMLRNATLIALDANLPEPSIRFLCEFAEDSPLFVDAVSAAKAPRLNPFLSSIHTLKAGALEAEAISGLRCRTERQLRRVAEWFHEQGTRRIFVSLGSKGVYYSDGKRYGIESVAKPATEMVNANGAGDALFAGLAYGWIEQLTMQDTLHIALAMAGITISHRATNHPDLSIRLVHDHLGEWYG